MSLTDCGPAIIMIYGDGKREMTLAHAQDGGEAYMGPLLRKAVQYAKTHYDSGDIAAVLMSEGEMRQIAESDVIEAASGIHARHIYYVMYRWDVDTAKKTYKIKALHLPQKHYATVEQLAEYVNHIPATARQLA